MNPIIASAFADELRLIKQAAPTGQVFSRLATGAREAVTRAVGAGGAPAARAATTGARPLATAPASGILGRAKELWTGSRSKLLKSQAAAASPGAYQEAAALHGISPGAVRGQHLTGPQGQALRNLAQQSAREHDLVARVQTAKNVGKVVLPLGVGAGVAHHVAQGGGP